MSAQLKPSPEISLLPDEHRWLASIPDGLVLPPDALIWVALNDQGRVVGRTSLTPMVMVEGSFVAPEYRGTRLAMRLIRTAENFMRENGRSHTMAMAWDAQPEVGDYLVRFGYEKAPLTLYMKDLNKKKGG